MYEKLIAKMELCIQAARSVNNDQMRTFWLSCAHKLGSKARALSVVQAQ